MQEWERIFPMRVRPYLEKVEWKNGLEEIRIRVGQPLEFLYAEEIKYLWQEEGTVSLKENKEKTKGEKRVICLSQEEVMETLNYISEYSLYAFQQEIRRGFLTMEGGHRVGMAGKVIWEGNEVKGISHITFLNIRVAHEKKGCAIPLLPYLKIEKEFQNTLLLSRAGIGKTTYLRDCIRLLSLGDEKGKGMKVGVVDERSEIAACHLGIPQNDVGPRTDVLDGCGKEIGMKMLLRSMSPQIIAVDELGEEADYNVVEQIIYSGSKILGTMHTGDINELAGKPFMEKWLRKKLIKRYVLLEKGEKGERRFQVFDENLKKIC